MNEPQRSVEFEQANNPVLSRDEGFALFKQLDSQQAAPQEQQTADVEPAAEEAPPAVEEPIEDVAEETADEEVAAPEETESEDDGHAYIPESFDELADALGLDANELANQFRVTSKVNGKAEQLPLADILSGYQLRQVSDRKMQELADQRKSLEAAELERQQNWQTKNDQLTVALDQINANIELYDDTQLNALLAKGDNQSYIWAKGRRDQLVKAKQDAETALKEQREKDTQEQASAKQARLQQQMTMMGQLRPELADPATAREVENKLTQYLITKYSYPAEVVNDYFQGGHWSAPDVDMYLKAMAWDELQASAHKKDVGQKRVKLGKVLKPGIPKDAPPPEVEKKRSVAAKFRKATKDPRGQNRADVQAAALEFMKAKKRG